MDKFEIKLFVSMAITKGMLENKDPKEVITEAVNSNPFCTNKEKDLKQMLDYYNKTKE